MGLESLKRVLMELKGEARKMRGAEVKTRMGPVKEVSRVPSEVGDVEEVSRVPADAEGDPTVTTSIGDVKEVERIGSDRALDAEDEDLKRVLRKHGIT